jgi:hypothetical protein
MKTSALMLLAASGLDICVSNPAGTYRSKASFNEVLRPRRNPKR